MSKGKDINDKDINYGNLKRFKDNLNDIIPKRVALTQAEYDLLTYEEKHNDTAYFITDGVANITEEDKEYIDSQDEQTLNSSKEYIDTKISDLINSAPSTLDTLGEIAEAMADNKDVVEALDEAIGTKATSADLTAHTGNTDNPHGVTKEQIELDKVENKSSSDIRGELTKSNVTTALGFTPPKNGFTKYQSTITYTMRENKSPIGSCTLSGAGDGFLVVTSEYEQYLYQIVAHSSISIYAIRAGSTEIPTATRQGNGTVSISNIPYIGSMTGGTLTIYSWN